MGMGEVKPQFAPQLRETLHISPRVKIVKSRALRAVNEIVWGSGDLCCS